MAGEFRRELSNKVFIGQCRIASLGFWRGAMAGLGLRRHLIDEHGITRAQLEFGQRKFLQTDRVVLRPGPPNEIETVRRVFKAFVSEGKSASAIARELNADNIHTTKGNLWRAGTVGDLLFNERYIGNIVYNRRSSKLQERYVRNPPDMWIRCDKAFEPIIPPVVFAKAQELRAKRRLRHRRVLSDQHVLAELSALFRREGRLSLEIIRRAKNVPSPTAIVRRFGSLAAAYDLVGFKLAPRYQRCDPRKRICRVIDAESQKLALHLNSLGRDVALGDMREIIIDGGLIVSVCIARPVTHIRGKHRWQLHWGRRGARTAPSDLTLVIKMDKMDETDSEIAQYYVLPLKAIDLARLSDQKLGFRTRVFAEDYKHSDLESVAAAISQWTA
jgi:hypothetical protein